MKKLFLSSENLIELDGVLAKAESKNGCCMYQYSLAQSSDCKRWDCAISCYCANSRD